MKKNGDPGDVSPRRLFSADTPLQERLAYFGWDITPEGCWEWRGSRAADGYGVLRFGDEIYVHRHMFRLHVGPIADGEVVRHSCDNPPCGNPDHLLTGTVADNMADKAHRGRSPSFRNGYRTTCVKRGHDITVPGALRTYTRKDGTSYQTCSECRRITSR